MAPPPPCRFRDIRRTVVFIYGQTQPGQDMFVRGGTRGGDPIRIRHRNWLNPHTNAYRWGDAYLDWNGGEVGQAVPLGGGSPVDWTTSLAQGQNQPYVCMAGYGIADEDHFGLHYWMLDVDMDCEQAFHDGLGHRWFELKAFIAPSPGWEGNIAQNSTPAPPYPSINHMGLCGLVNVFVANFANRPGGLDPNFAQFSTPTYTYLTPVDERNASADIVNNTLCASPGVERTSGGNFVQMCQRSTGVCCTPGNGNNCQ